MGTLDLTATAIGAIYDEQACWPQKGDLRLNRCQYGAFIGGPIDAASRLGWLARQVPERWGEDFWPQPYEQLSTVLREMGHDEEARAVLIMKERLQRRARRARARNPLLRAALAVNDGVLAVTVRYGRQPLLALVWLILFWAIGVVVFALAEQSSALKPNSRGGPALSGMDNVRPRANRQSLHALDRTGHGRTCDRPDSPNYPASSASPKRPAIPNSMRGCIRWMPVAGHGDRAEAILEARPLETQWGCSP